MSAKRNGKWYAVTAVGVPLDKAALVFEEGADGLLRPLKTPERKELAQGLCQRAGLIPTPVEAEEQAFAKCFFAACKHGEPAEARSARAVEALRRAEDAGVAAIAFHARFTSQGHAGTVHLDVLREIVAEARIPVYGNGSIIDRPSAEAMAATGVRALLIARAALENPCVFTFDKGDPCALAERHLELELRYRAQAERFSRLRAEASAVLTFRRHLFRYFKGLPGANALRARLMELQTVADVRAAIAAFRNP